jgi:hypothetical protein
VLFAAGTVVSFFSELWGGVIMLLSVIGFNIALGCFFGSYEFEFWFFLIPALMLIIYSFLTKRKFNIDK